MILDNLGRPACRTPQGRAARLRPLDPYAGAWIHARGEYTDADGKTRRVAVSIGPEHGTVGPQQVKEAAKEAVQGVGFDMLVVCGFAFDPHVAEEAKRYGKLTVLPAKMNPDLAMGDELLKKTGAGNLFMVFGEPDVEITRRRTDRSPSRSRAWTSTTRRPVRSAALHRRHRLLVHRHRLQRRELLRPPRLFHAAPTNPTTNSNGPCGPTSTRRRGALSTAP